MPVMLQIEFHNAVQPNTRRLSSAFTRLGWEHVDTGQYRFPKTDRPVQEVSVADLLNHIVPSLMVLRAFLLSQPQSTLNIFSMTMIPGVELDPGQKDPVALPADAIVQKGYQEFGAERLRDMISGFVWPYQN